MRPIKFREEKQIIKENWDRFNKLANLRIEQLKQTYGCGWWEMSIKDETYKFICWHLTQLKIWAKRINYERN